MSEKIKQSASENSASARQDAVNAGGSLKPDDLASHIDQPGAAPVHLWNPPYCGEIDMRIARDGTWYHEGRPIRRTQLVNLFSSVLKKEGDRHYLVTPVEKVGIQVEDCPYVVRTAEITGEGQDQQVVLVLNTGQRVPLDSQHPLEVTQDPDSGEPHPRVMVRNGLRALLSRNVFYQLVDRAQSRPGKAATVLEIRSFGRAFELGRFQE